MVANFRIPKGLASIGQHRHFLRLLPLAFITLRVPPMVLGVGLGLVWECVPYVVSQGKGLNLFGVSGVEILSQTSFVVVLMVVAGTVDVAFSTQMSATLGLASNAPVVTNMFAMILGGYIGSRSNQAVGIIVAALTIKLFSFGLTRTSSGLYGTYSPFPT